MALTELSAMVGMDLSNFRVENVRTEHQLGCTRVTVSLIAPNGYSSMGTYYSITAAYTAWNMFGEEEEEDDYFVIN